MSVFTIRLRSTANRIRSPVRGSEYRSTAVVPRGGEEKTYREHGEVCHEVIIVDPYNGADEQPTKPFMTADLSESLLEPYMLLDCIPNFEVQSSVHVADNLRTKMLKSITSFDSAAQFVPKICKSDLVGSR